MFILFIIIITIFIDGKEYLIKIWIFEYSSLFVAVFVIILTRHIISVTNMTLQHRKVSSSIVPEIHCWWAVVKSNIIQFTVSS